MNVLRLWLLAINEYEQRWGLSPFEGSIPGFRACADSNANVPVVSKLLLYVGVILSKHFDAEEVPLMFMWAVACAKSEGHNFYDVSFESIEVCTKQAGTGSLSAQRTLNEYVKLRMKT